MFNAADSFKHASVLYGNAVQPSRSNRASSRALMAEFWLARDFETRRKIVDRFDVLALESRKASDEGDPTSKSQCLLDFLEFFRESANLSSEFVSLKNRFDQAVQTGKDAITELEKLGETEKLVEGLSLIIWLLAVEAQIVLGPKDFEALGAEVRKIERRLEDASRKLGTPYALCLAKKASGHVAFDVNGDPGKASLEYEEASTIARALGDSLLLGRLEWWNCQVVFWLAGSESDPLKRHDLFQKSLAYASDAIRNLEVPFQTTELTAAYGKAAECHIELASLESNLPRKRAELTRAIELASQGSTFESGTWAWIVAASALSRAISALSKLEEPNQRIQLLRQALKIREQTVQAIDHILPHFWNAIVNRYYLGLLRSELASIEERSQAKKLLTQAASDIELCLKEGESWETTPGFTYRLAQYRETFGDILSQIFAEDKSTETAQRAIEVYEESVSRFVGSNHFAAAAPVRWKISNINDRLGDFYTASEEFGRAGDDFRKGASEVPGSASIFRDLSLYMEAWANVETGRYYHGQTQYSLASKSYLAASTVLEGTQSWRHLAPLFAARSILERAEGLSQGEKHDEAVREFRSAVKFFREATTGLEKIQLATTDAIVAEQLSNWTEIARQRESYCRGRVELEEAREADKKGEKGISSRKFRAASAIFTALVGKEQNQHDREELQAGAEFCDAWALMKEAETTSSPELFLEAAEAFARISTVRKGEHINRLALADASVCKALALGTKFRQSRDTHSYAEVKKHLEAAADYYGEAGFKRTALWTRATQRLFDSLLFISDAEVERSPDKKAALYHVAEKHLELAAKLYDEAGFPAKKEETLKQIDLVREEKNVLLAPMQALAQIPTTTGTSVAFVPHGRLQPGGVEKFEEAFVVGEVFIPQNEIPLSDNFVLTLDIANVGKAPATLVKIESALPEGFRLQQDSGFRLEEGGVVDLKGGRLEHLKTHQIKMPIKASQSGTFEFRPRVSYVDDQGNYRSYVFHSKSLTVVDMGLLKKPIALQTGTITPSTILPQGFRFETERAEEIFQLLVKEFLKDYMTRRLYVEEAGWRTLMDLVKETKMPRSALYGPAGRNGPVLTELERRGLVEIRIFPQERGRGGSIKKVRVAYDNAIVKRIVEQTVIQTK